MLGKHTSIWIDTTVKTHYPSLTKNVTVDVVVVGGGIAGIMAAYFLKQAGKKVVLLEAGRIVEGVTGQTTAKVSSLHGLKYDFLIKKFGKDGAQIYADSNQWAIGKIAELTKKLKIDCNFTYADAYTYTKDEGHLSNIKKEVEAAKKLGLPASYVKGPNEFKSRGAIYFKNQAYFHPRKFLLPIAAKIPGDGSYIFENTTAFNIKEDEPCRVETDKGNIKAKKVIIATHFPFYDKNFYFVRLIPSRSYALAATLDTFPKDMYYGINKSYFSYRPQPYKKGMIAIIGGQEHKTGQGGDTRKRYESVLAEARKHFDVKEVLYHWSTQDNDPLDQVPYIGLHAPGAKHVYVTTGYAGWGMTTGVLSAEILTGLITKESHKWATLYSPLRLKTITSAKGLGKQSMDTVVEYIKKIVPKEHFNDIKKGDAKVVQYNDKKIAVYRDDKGKLHAVSAVCTHMGCIVNWNNAEKSWDCPCHGSRFDHTGKVLHGPALKPLEKRKIK